MPYDDADDAMLDLLDGDDNDAANPAASPDSTSLPPLCMSSVSIPFSDPDFLHANVDALDPASRALYALDIKIRELNVSHSHFYSTLRSSEPYLAPSAALHMHMDGGSMATTCDRLDHLWHVKWFPTGAKVPALCVADDFDHHPRAHSFICVATADGPKLFSCYYMPTLPVTIISPSATSKHFGCEGHSSYSSNTGHDSFVHLHHCCRLSGNKCIPLLTIHGLLYTAPLLKPLTKAKRNDPHPSPHLHVDRLPAAPSSPSALCTCTSLSACGEGMSGCGEGTSGCGEGSSACGLGPCPTVHPAPILPDPLPDRLLWHQWLGSQLDVSLETLLEHATGVQSWSLSMPLVCGHCHPASSTPSLVSPASPTPSLEDLLNRDPDNATYTLHHLTHDQQHVPIATELDNCPICARAKLHHAHHGLTNTCHATMCNQGISIDFGFIIQKSNDSDRVHHLKGLNGEMCYCLIIDHHSGTLYGETFHNKCPLIDFLNCWLAQHGLPSDIPDKSVCFDVGGDLGKCHDVLVALFEKAGYAIETTTPDSSHQNGPSERPHHTIGDALCVLLGGAGLPAKFRPYTFQHYLRLNNVTVHCNCTASPYELCSGQKPDLHYLRVFGCHVYALPSRPHCPDKLTSDARVGVFLGFAKTMKNVLYYNTVTEMVKMAQNVAFDESMHDLPNKPPNARLLDGLHHHRPNILDFTMPIPDLDVSTEFFTLLSTVSVPYDPDSATPLGLSFDTCSHLCHAYVKAIHQPPTHGTLHAFRHDHIGSYSADLSEIKLSMVIQQLQTKAMTPEERKRLKLTQCNLQCLPNWREWDAAFDAQLDAHLKAGAIAPPIPRPAPIDSKKPNVLCIQWSNVVKPNGTRKARACLDGFKCSAPGLRKFAPTYASCIEQPCMQLFFAITAAKGLTITITNTKNAYQQSPPPLKKCYLLIDDAYCSWHRKCFGKDVDPRMHVVPLEHALEAGALWEKMIVGILESNELQFTLTTHERNLYCGEIDGQLVLVCRQVNDFAIASKSTQAAEKLISVINHHATTESKGIGIRDSQGIGFCYNGLNIHQTRDYIKLSCKTYIDRVLQTHGWETPGARESDQFNSVLMSADVASNLLTIAAGPAEDTPEHRTLESEVGFGYRQVLASSSMPMLYVILILPSLLPCSHDLLWLRQPRNTMSP